MHYIFFTYTFLYDWLILITNNFLILVFLNVTVTRNMLCQLCHKLGLLPPFSLSLPRSLSLSLLYPCIQSTYSQSQSAISSPIPFNVDMFLASLPVYWWMFNVHGIISDLLFKKSISQVRLSLVCLVECVSPVSCPVPCCWHLCVILDAVCGAVSRLGLLARHYQPTASSSSPVTGDYPVFPSRISCVTPVLRPASSLSVY